MKPLSSVPASAPPFPPIEYLNLKRRRYIILSVILLFLFILIIIHLFVYNLPDARGKTGIPLPGLRTEINDIEIKNAPNDFFIPLEWETLRPLLIFSDTGVIDAKKNIPDTIMKLNGKPAVVTGFMVPLDAGDKTLDFVIVPDMARCWFCEPPDPTRTVYARGAFGKVDAEYDRPIKAYGILNIEPIYSSSVIHSILRLRVVRIERL